MRKKLTKAQQWEKTCKEAMEGRTVGRVDVFDDGLLIYFYTGVPDYCKNKRWKITPDFADLHQLMLRVPNRGCPELHGTSFDKLGGE